jgi:hypothetical protein
MLQKQQVQKEYSLSPPNFIFSNTVLTINRSRGDRPVYSPVLTANAPVEVSIPGLTLLSCHVIRWLIIDNESLRFRFLSLSTKSIA